MMFVWATLFYFISFAHGGDPASIRKWTALQREAITQGVDADKVMRAFDDFRILYPTAKNYEVERAALLERLSRTERMTDEWYWIEHAYYWRDTGDWVGLSVEQKNWGVPPEAEPKDGKQKIHRLLEALRRGEFRFRSDWLAVQARSPGFFRHVDPEMHLLDQAIMAGEFPTDAFSTLGGFDNPLMPDKFGEKLFAHAIKELREGVEGHSLALQKAEGNALKADLLAYKTTAKHAAKMLVTLSLMDGFGSDSGVMEHFTEVLNALEFANLRYSAMLLLFEDAFAERQIDSLRLKKVSRLAQTMVKNMPKLGMRQEKLLEVLHVASFDDESDSSVPRRIAEVKHLLETPDPVHPEYFLEKANTCAPAPWVCT